MPQTIHTPPPGSYTLTGADDGAAVILDGASPRTLTGPPVDGPAPVAKGFFCDAYNVGGAAVTFAPQGEATVNGSAELEIPGGSARRLLYIGGGAWLARLGG